MGQLALRPARRAAVHRAGHPPALPGERPLEDADADPLVVRVVEAYPNCPQYIQRRHLVVASKPAAAEGDGEVGTALGAAEQRLLAASDTFFMGSANPDGELDASHRGGTPGFVAVLDTRTLRVPDYAGNSMFNTLGNLRLEPRAGLLVVDLDTGQTLQLSGTAEVDLDADPDATGGTGRAWMLTVTGWRRARLGARLRSELLDYSPFNPPVAVRAGPSPSAPASYLPLRVTAAVPESATTRSLQLAPSDGVLAHWRGGQFLPVALWPPGASEPVLRTYTISSVPADGTLRLTVQREPAARPGLAPGVASTYLHDEIGPGDELLAAPPRGRFILDDSDRPVVLLSGGIGITPMLAMLRELAAAEAAGARPRRVAFIHSVRSARDRPFARELAELAGALHHARVYLVNTQEGDRRVDAGWLRRVLPFDDYVFFLCGPQGFMQAMYDALRATGVRDADVHAEAFGPSALRRAADGSAGTSRPSGAGASAPPSEQAAQAATVVFARSGKEVAWAPQAGTLLELAEASGIPAPFSCRAGACQSCAVRLTGGEVTYPVEPVVAVPDGSVLTCSAVPRVTKDRPAPTIRLEL